MSSLATLPRDVTADARFTPSAVLGTVAHELRQPLSNIEAIAYYLSMVLPRGDAKLQAQLARIRELVEQSSWILSSGLRLSAPTPVSPPVTVPVVLDELITEAISSSGASQVNVNLALGGDLPLVHLDPRDARDLVDLLLMLFRTAAAGGPVLVTTSAGPEGGVLLEIRTSGDGPRSIAGAGSELAIESIQRIAESHGGIFELDAGGAAGGIRGRLMLP